MIGAIRQWSARMWAGRYWPKVGAAASEADPRYVLVVPYQQRTFSVPYQQRTFTVPAED